MSKRSRYKESKQRERAQLLTDDQGIPFDQALQIVIDRQIAATKLLKGMGKSNKKRAKIFAARDVSDTPFSRLEGKIYGSTTPLQGGSPGQGKRS
ncbi:hypothetical protein [Pseudomonas chlororaphis]|uniref:hypothetical protein n=1 Tax=Pseudomonas chlororaphis TaxID=587753 RepID=UPI000F54F97E|nr:hypothetical protein [Pseudomonas chlororaphis]